MMKKLSGDDNDQILSEIDGRKEKREKYCCRPIPVLFSRRRLAIFVLFFERGQKSHVNQMQLQFEFINLSQSSNMCAREKLSSYLS